MKISYHPTPHLGHISLENSKIQNMPQIHCKFSWNFLGGTAPKSPNPKHLFEFHNFLTFLQIILARNKILSTGKVCWKLQTVAVKSRVLWSTNKIVIDRSFDTLYENFSNDSKQLDLRPADPFTRIDPKLTQVVPWSLHTFPENFMQIGPAIFS